MLYVAHNFHTMSNLIFKRKLKVNTYPFVWTCWLCPKRKLTFRLKGLKMVFYFCHHARYWVWVIWCLSNSTYEDLAPKILLFLSCYAVLLCVCIFFHEIFSMLEKFFVFQSFLGTTPQSSDELCFLAFPRTLLHKFSSNLSN